MGDAATTFVRENRRWFLLGIAGWSTVALLNALSPGLGRVAAGMPLTEAFQDFVPRVVAVGVLAALSPFVFLAFERVRAPGRSRWITAPLYVLVGLAFWVFSCLAMVGLVSAGILPPPVDPALLRTDLFSAYLASTAFNIPVLFLVMVLCHQVVRRLHEIRQQEVQAARLQAELAGAQAAELRTRLNPEFLFQTFAVASDLMQRDRLAARRVLSDFSEILRVSLGRNGEQRIALRDEIGLLERYLDIQKARIEGRLRIRFDVADEATASRVPPLLLQPLVENWLEPSAEPRRVEISARRANGHLHLAVGASGLSGGAGGERPTDEAIGIAGVRTRLQLIYGADALLTCSRPAAGEARVEVRIPDHLEDATADE